MGLLELSFNVKIKIKILSLVMNQILEKLGKGQLYEKLKEHE